MTRELNSSRTADARPKPTAAENNTAHATAPSVRDSCLYLFPSPTNENSVPALGSRASRALKAAWGVERSL